MSHLLHSTTSTFFEDVVQSPVPVLVDFYADWCGPCQMLSPTLERLANELAGKARIVKVNIDHSPDLAREYRVQAVPTLVAFLDGEAAGRAEGAVAEPVLRQTLNRLVAARNVA
jgi:thioredoxin